MGQRANFVIREGGRCRVYYDHWAANILDSMVLLGPEYIFETIEFLDEKFGQEWLLDERWCEGLVLVDLDSRHLIWFGGEEVLYDLSWRATHRRILEVTWNGWTVDWAHSGVAALAEFLGVARGAVLVEQEESVSSPLRQWPEIPEDNDLLVSVLEDGRARVWRFDQVAGTWPSAETLSALDDFETCELPLQIALADVLVGIHVDRDRAEVIAWSGRVDARRNEFGPAQWPGFTLRLVDERYEEQEKRVEGLSFVSAPEEFLFAEHLDRAERMLRRACGDPTPSTVAALRAAGLQVEVLAPTHETRSKAPLLDRALQTLAKLQAKFVGGVQGPD